MTSSSLSKLARVFLASATVLASAVVPSQACTGIELTNKDGSTVSGRTVEFGVKIDASIAIVPHGFAFTGRTPAGDGLKYTAKHAAVGVYAYSDVKLMDGINDAGLVAGAFYLPTYADYTPVTAENQAKGVSPAEFPNFLLTQYASVDEVRKAIAAGDVVITPTVLPGWGAAAPPFHYVVYDKTGASIVIEPIGGKLVVHDDPLGVVTNSPTFDWHMTNLSNYVTMTGKNIERIDLAGKEIRGLGQGSGMLGLPGDFTPPSRFVRAVAFSKTALPVERARDGVLQAFHLLNQFDIPKGAARGVEHGQEVADYTLWTSAADLKNLRYYFRTYDSSRIRMVDMKAVDLDAKEIKKISMKGEEEIEDVSGKAK